jgi:hypothetical protein
MTEHYSHLGRAEGRTCPSRRERRRFQPGGSDTAHDDECLSDSCQLYVHMTGKFDAFPVAESPSASK